MSEILKGFEHEAGCKGADYHECTCIPILRKRAAALEAVTSALVNQIRVVENSREYQDVWFTNQLHNGPYTGPQYGAEIDAVESALHNYAGALAAHDAKVRADERAETMRYIVRRFHDSNTSDGDNAAYLVSLLLDAHLHPVAEQTEEAQRD